MSAITDLSNILLRQESDVTAGTKGSTLTEKELDDNIKYLIRAAEELGESASSQFDAWDIAETYLSDITYYVSYDQNIYKFIGTSDSTGEQPDLYPAKWELTSQGELTHAQNTDLRLADYTFNFTDANISSYYNAVTKNVDIRTLEKTYNIFSFNITGGIEIDFITRNLSNLILLTFLTDDNIINDNTGSSGIKLKNDETITLDTNGWIFIRGISRTNDEIITSIASSGGGDSFTLDKKLTQAPAYYADGTVKQIKYE